VQVECCGILGRTLGSRHASFVESADGTRIAVTKLRDGPVLLGRHLRDRIRGRPSGELGSRYHDHEMDVAAR